MTGLEQFAQKPKVLAITALISIGLVFLQSWFSLATIDRTRDSYSYYYAAKAISQHSNPYDLDVLQAIAGSERMYEGVGPYVYPPFFAALWRSLTWLSAQQAHAFLIIGGALLFAWALWLLTRIVRPTRHPHALLFLFLLFQIINGPVVTSLRMGQITPLIALLILICLHAHRQGRDTLSALALALAILIKIAPAVLLIYFVFFYPRRWSYLAKVAGWIALFIVGSLPLATAAAWRYYLQGSAAGLPLQAPYSIWGWLQLHTLPSAFLESHKLYIYLSSSLALTALTMLSIRNHEPTDRSVYAFSMLIMLSLLIAPLTWHQHFYLCLLPAFYFAADHWGNRHYLRTTIWVLLIFVMMSRAPEPILLLRPVGTLIAMLLEMRWSPIKG